MIDYAAANARYRRQRSALTRATNRAKRLNSAEAWTKVVDTVDDAEREWEAAEAPTPDDWARWHIARNDAIFALYRLEG